MHLRKLQGLCHFTADHGPWSTHLAGNIEKRYIIEGAKFFVPSFRGKSLSYIINLHDLRIKNHHHAKTWQPYKLLWCSLFEA